MRKERNKALKSNEEFRAVQNPTVWIKTNYLYRYSRNSWSLVIWSKNKSWIRRMQTDRIICRKTHGDNLNSLNLCNNVKASSIRANKILEQFLKFNEVFIISELTKVTKIAKINNARIHKSIIRAKRLKNPITKKQIEKIHRTVQINKKLKDRDKGKFIKKIKTYKEFRIVFWKNKMVKRSRKNLFLWTKSLITL